MREAGGCGTEEQRNVERRLGRTGEGTTTHSARRRGETAPRKATAQRASDRVPGGKKPCTEHALRERRRRKACRQSQRVLTQHERGEEIAVVAEGAPVRGPNRKAAHARLEVSQDRGDTDKRHRDRVAVGDLRNTVERAGDGRSEELAVLCVARNSGFRGRTRGANGEEEREQLNTRDGCASAEAGEHRCEPGIVEQRLDDVTRALQCARRKIIEGRRNIRWRRLRCGRRKIIEGRRNIRWRRLRCGRRKIIEGRRNIRWRRLRSNRGRR